MDRIKMVNPLKTNSFALIGLVVLLLITGSVIEQIYGTEHAMKYVYTAPWTIILWLLAI